MGIFRAGLGGLSLATALILAAGVASGEVITERRRADADCSARLTAADAIAAVRGLGAESVCGNDDCDHDGTVAANDVDCTARCLFGACPIPSHAPIVSQIDPELTPQIVPLSALRITGSNFGAADAFKRVTIGGLVAAMVEADVPGELLVVIPNLPPGTYPLVVSQDGLAGAAVPITIVAPTAIAPPDTAESTAFLLDQVIAAFLELDLEGHYGDEAAITVRETLLDLRLQLLTEFLAFGNNTEISAEERARLDAAIDSSGVPERLREILEEIGAGGTAGEGGAAGTLVVGAIARNIGATIVAGAGLLELLGTVAAPHLAAIAHLLGIGAGVLISLPTLLTPVITQFRYVDAAASPRQFATQGGYVHVRVANLLPNAQVHMIAKTADFSFDLVPEATGTTIQYRLPPGTPICGPISFAVQNQSVGYRSSTIYSYVQPEALALRATKAKPHDAIGLDSRGTGSCETLATFKGRSPADTPVSHNSFTNVSVPNVLPGDYLVGLLVPPIPSREMLPLKIELAITGVKVTCDLRALATLPNMPYRTDCKAEVEPAGAPAPPGTVFVWSSSDTGTATVQTDEASLTSVVVAQAPGTTNISATLQAPDNIRFTSNAVEIRVIDGFPPVIREVSTTATSPVPAGGAISVHVRVTDNELVSRVILRASGDAAVEAEQEIPCLMLESTCEVDFTVHVKEMGFTATSITLTAEAVDGGSNHSTGSPQLTLAIGGDNVCPAVSITSPADRATVSPGATGRVNAQATDSGVGASGVTKFIYSATGPALVRPIVEQELPVLPMPLPLANLGFNFEVKSEQDLASVTDRNIHISVQAVDAAGNKCEAQQLTLTVAGSGDVQITLVWSDTNDLDLRVVEPSGTVIYYGNKTSPTGGRLDVDANAGCDGTTSSPVENVFWPVGQAPTGEYRVVVSYYEGCTEPAVPSNFTVNITVDGVARAPVSMSIFATSLEVATFTR